MPMKARTIRVPVGASYADSLDEMAKAAGNYSAQHLATKFIGEFLNNDRSGILSPVAAGTSGYAIYEITLTHALQEGLGQLRSERNFKEAESVLLGSIIENRVRDRRREGHEAEVKT